MVEKMFHHVDIHSGVVYEYRRPHATVYAFGIFPFAVIHSLSFHSFRFSLLVHHVYVHFIHSLGNCTVLSVNSCSTVPFNDAKETRC
jgi:hypothetical protein